MFFHVKHGQLMHLIFHLVVPAVVALLFFRVHGVRAFAIMMATMLVDLDHLFADPIYDPQRCSIGFHPLHQLWFIAVYVGLSCYPKTRLVGLGLVLHMALDSIDCQTTNGIWMTPKTEEHTVANVVESKELPIIKSFLLRGNPVG
jgi:hypothetical protein